MGVLDALLDGDRVEEAFAAEPAPARPYVASTVRDARSSIRKRGLKPNSVKLSRGSGANDPDFEKKHPRGKSGTSQGGKFVRKGSSGEDVRAVQSRVGARVDGKFGALTQTAVRRFQRQHGLQVDGVVGRQTALALAGKVEKAKRVGVGRLTAHHRELIRKAAKRRPGGPDRIPRRAGGGRTV